MSFIHQAISYFCLEKSAKICYIYSNNRTVTKYVYGRGLIGEESGGTFKTYHFDNRGSTVVITDTSGKVTDAFRYDTYGRMTEHVGGSDVIFGYNGRDGVVTDKNGLIYMRARYYSPVLRRFVNADVVAGKLSNAITLNRYAYANGNPVSNIDPFGLSADRWRSSTVGDFVSHTSNFVDGLDAMRECTYTHSVNSVKTATKPKRTPKGSWIQKTEDTLDSLDNTFGNSSKFAKGLDVAGDALTVAGVVVDVGMGVVDNINNGEELEYIISDAAVDFSFSAAAVGIGMAVGSVLPGAGTIVGAVAGFVVGIVVDEVFDFVTEEMKIFNGKSLKESAKEAARRAVDFLKFW